MGIEIYTQAFVRNGRRFFAAFLREPDALRDKARGWGVRRCILPVLPEYSRMLLKLCPVFLAVYHLAAEKAGLRQ